jgi:hypothetical protein
MVSQTYAELTLPVQYVADTRILEHCNTITKFTEKQYCNPGNKEMEYRNIATKVVYQKYHKITMETLRNNTVMEATKKYCKWNIGILQ